MRCHCGLLLHYTNINAQHAMEQVVKWHGEFINVSVGGRTWAVQRHYIALHGIWADELPTLGFDEVSPR